MTYQQRVRFLVFLASAALVLSGCGSSPEVKEDEERELRPGLFSRTLDILRGDPDRIEEAGKPRIDRLELVMEVEPEKILLAETRRLEVAATLRNTGRRQVTLLFPTSQRIEIEIQDAAGQILSRWSEDRLFAQQTGYLVLNPREQVQYKGKITTREMSAGKEYIVRVYLPAYPELSARLTVKPAR